MKTASEAVRRAMAAREAISQFLGSWNSPEFKALDAEDDRSHAALEKAPILTLDDANAMVEFGRLDDNDLACEVALRRGVDWLRGRASADDAAAKGGVQSEWLNREQAAAYAGLSYQTFSNLAVTGKGPKMKKTSPRHVLYHKDDLDEWIRNNGSRPRRR